MDRSDASIDLLRCTQELFATSNPDDIFLTLQRSTAAVFKIYNEYLAMTKNDFITGLSDLCCIAELRYVRDILYAVVKRKLNVNNLGQLTERRSGTNVKDNLVKDVYNLYSFGEGSLHSLPKSMFKSELKFCHQEIQTDSCLSQTLFASKSDVDNVKNDLLAKLTELREEFLSKQASALTTNPPFTVINLPRRQSEITVGQSASSEHDSESSSASQNVQSSVYDPGNSNSTYSGLKGTQEDNDSRPTDISRKIIIVGDSLLHRMNSRKMKVTGIPVVKLTKPDNCLGGALSRCTNYVAKHNNVPFDVVLLAGTNDLSKREVKPEDLIENLDKSLTELIRFQNVNEIFLCKIPPRCNYVSINTKVKLYNQLLFERFYATEEFITVIESIPKEIRFFYQDGLHISDLGLTKLCSTILSKLYNVLVPSSQNKRNRFLRRQSRQ